MSDLAGIALILGGSLAMLYLLMAAMPEQALRFLNNFSRNRPVGIILTCVAVLWAGWLLYQMPMGRFDGFKPLLLILVPVAILLIVSQMSELLPVRALGGLLLLIPAPLLDAARWHHSPARLVVTVCAYIMVVKGIVFLLSPFRFRQAVKLFIRDAGFCRAWGLAGLVFAICLLAFAVTVY